MLGLGPSATQVRILSARPFINMNCLNCNKETNNPKFCSKSCSASFSNKRRKHSIETKRKISSSLGGKGIALEEKFCSICGKQGIQGENYCGQCYSKLPPSESTIQAGRLAWRDYEFILLPHLESTHGPLSKEIINGITFDYCNSSYIIEFTFDYGRGTSDIIKRFQKIKKDERKRIAYIPDHYVGQKRRAKFEKLEVELYSSTSFKQYL